MGRLIVFNNISLDGYFTDAHGDIGWAYKEVQDAEWNAFVQENASGEGSLVLGRITYEMMAGYWATPAAFQNDPAVAKGMNRLQKLVFSRTLQQAAWQNTVLIHENIASEIANRKHASENDLVILGSGSIVSQLTQARLIDEYQMVVNPVILGSGRTQFEGAQGQFSLRLFKTRAFQNGNVVLWYEPVA